MGWIARLRDWGRRLWPSDAIPAAANYSYQTMIYALEQAYALPEALLSIATHAPTQNVAKHLLRIAGEDLLPLVLVSYTSHLIQTQGRDYIKEEPDHPWLSTRATLQAGLYFLQAATWAFKIRKQTQLLVRTTIVAIEAPPAINSARLYPPLTICQDEQCSTLRFIQGSLRNVVTYWATEAAISLVGYIPVAGKIIATPASIYHRGRYVLSIVLPEVCNRHQVIYFREHSELALSLGLGHLSGSWIVNSMIERATGIPAVFYASTVDQFLLIMQMSVVSQMRLPAPLKSSARAIPDPVLPYQNGVGFLFDTLLLGLKTKIPRMLKDQNAVNFTTAVKTIPIQELFSFIEAIRQNRMARILLPPLVRSLKSFRHDEIIQFHWPALQIIGINTLNNFASLSNHPAIRLSSVAPGVTSSLVETFFGTPRIITKVLLQLITNEDVIALVKTWRQQIENDQRNRLTTVDKDECVFVENKAGSTERRERMPIVTLHLPQLTINQNNHFFSPNEQEEEWFDAGATLQQKQ